MVRNFNSADPRELLVAQVFSSLCRSTLAEKGDSVAKEQRLWQLPAVATHFVFEVITDDEKQTADRIVHQLRGEVGELINRQLDRMAAKQDLAERLDECRQELVLRPWRNEDAPRLAALLNNPRLWEGLPDEYPGNVTEDLANELISIANGWSERHVVYAVECQRDLVGQLRLQFDSSPYPDTAEISYWVGEPYWNKGLGSKMVTLFTAECFNRHLHLYRLFAVVLEGNVASMRVLEKAGYRYESFRYRNVTKSGAKHSTHVFGLCRSDYRLTLRGEAS